ncbi:MAG: hypothetical protein NTX53_07050 [candidate division WOR-3 bacterium]|nr:hypothetical protein [candidate division WOR-3 bacterium]
MNRKAVFAIVALWLADSMLVAVQAAEPAEITKYHNLWQQRWSHVETAARPGFGLSQDPAAFMIDTSVVFGPATGDQCHPALASSGSGWLAVWSDGRDYTLRAARLDSGGALRDTSGLVIGALNYLPTQSAVAFDGANYLVVWETGSYMWDGDVKAAHISPAGILLDTFVVSEALNGQYNPWVASAGDTSLVVWLDGRSGAVTEVYGARVLRSGAVLDPEGIRVSETGSFGSAMLAIAYGHGEFLTAWSSYDTLGQRVISACRVGVDGSVIDTNAIVLRTSSAYDATEPTIAFGDTFFLVAWQEGDYSQMDILGRRVTVGGSVLDPTCIKVAQFADQQEQAAATFDGTNYLVTWLDIDYDYNQTMRARRVTTAGVLLDPNQIRICPTHTAAGAPAACYSGASFVVAWDDGWSSGGADVYCARVSSAGTVIDTNGIVLPLGADAQQLPAVAFDGTNYLAVWQEQGGALFDLYAARVAPDGTVLDPGGVLVSRDVVDGVNSAMAFGAGEYLVVWNVGSLTDTMTLRAARVTPSGVVLDTTPIQLGAGLAMDGYPNVAFDGTNFLVVWYGIRTSTIDIFGARVAPDGTVLDPTAFDIYSGDSMLNALPSVAFDGANYLVAWMRGYESADVWGARVSPAGTVLAPGPFAVCAASAEQSHPRVAAGPTSSLVTWMDNRVMGNYFDIYAARVSHDGTVQDPGGLIVTNTSGDEGDPEVIFDGSNYSVFWLRMTYDSGAIGGAKLDTSGRVTAMFPSFGSASYQTYPRAASGGGAGPFVVYDCWTGTAGRRAYDNYRVWGRLGPFIGVEEGRPPLTADRSPLTATIIRSTLFLPLASGAKRGAPSAFLDISGRKVLDLHPGPNDVRALAPGVYFVREEPQAASPKPQAVRKVVISR